MSLDLMQEKGVPLEEQRFTWRELVQRAEQLRERSKRLLGLGSSDAAKAGLARADSLLQLAASLAPDWNEPILQSARVGAVCGGRGR
jgi:hypothetical protein